MILELDEPVNQLTNIVASVKMAKNKTITTASILFYRYFRKNKHLFSIEQTLLQPVVSILPMYCWREQVYL